MKVELVYEQSCPNVAAAREQLLRAFALARLAPHWREWEPNQTGAPPYVRECGSPTILVDGEDVSGDAPAGDGPNCRVYAVEGVDPQGVPPLRDISQALFDAAEMNARQFEDGRLRLNGATLPAVGVALLPKVFCPACWPAYAGLLGSLGIGFVDYTPYLLPLTTLFLLLALAGLAWRAPTRRGYGPPLMGLSAAVTLLAGKFAFDSDAAMYASLLLLVLSSLWNTWPKPRPEGTACPACTSTALE